MDSRKFLLYSTRLSALASPSQSHEAAMEVPCLTFFSINPSACRLNEGSRSFSSRGAAGGLSVALIRRRPPNESCAGSHFSPQPPLATGIIVSCGLLCCLSAPHAYISHGTV